MGRINIFGYTIKYTKNNFYKLNFDLRFKDRQKLLIIYSFYFIDNIL